MQVNELLRLIPRLESGREGNPTYTKTKEDQLDWSVVRRNCLLTYVIEGKIEGTRRRGRRRKHLLDGLAEKKRILQNEMEALDRNLWRTRCGTGYGPVVRQTTE